MTLGHRARIVDIVVGDHQHAAPFRPRIGRHADRVVDVQRAIGAERRGRSHRTSEDHRLVALDDEVEEVRGFLHRIGAVRDRDAVDVRCRQQAIDFGRQRHPQLVVHVLTADRRHLHAADVREPSSFAARRR